MPSAADNHVDILKTVFGRAKSGEWRIKHMISLPLRSADGDQDFYQIAEGPVLAQPNYLSTVLSTLGQSIVPIVALVPGEARMRCLGTGFFVSATGMLITAAHVVLDPIERVYGDVRPIDGVGWDISRLNLGVMVRTNSAFQERGWIFRRIEWFTLLARIAESPLPFGRQDLKLTTDTAIGKVENPVDRDPYQPLAIVQPGLTGVGLSVGKRAVAIGYGSLRDVDLHDEGTGRVSGDFQFDLHVAQGIILERFSDNDLNKRVMSPGPCFSASLKLPAGMSGSPIFDDERIYVHGVVSMGSEDEDGPIAHGYGSMLANCMALPIKPLGDQSLIDLLKQRQHGMVRLSIPDA